MCLIHQFFYPAKERKTSTAWKEKTWSRNEMTVNPHDNPRWKAVQNIYYIIIYNSE